MISILVLHMLKYKLKISIPDPNKKLFRRIPPVSLSPSRNPTTLYGEAPKAFKNCSYTYTQLQWFGGGKKDNKKSKQNIKSNTKNKNWDTESNEL